MESNSPELLRPDQSPLIAATAEFNQRQREIEAQDRERWEKISITLHALAIVIKDKFGITEAEWSQAVAEAKHRH